MNVVDIVDHRAQLGCVLVVRVPKGVHIRKLVKPQLPLDNVLTTVEIT